MEPDEAVRIANAVFLRFKGRSLKAIEEDTLRGILNRQSNQEIEDTYHWSIGAIKNATRYIGEVFAHALNAHGVNVQRVYKNSFYSTLTQLRDFGSGQTVQKIIPRDLTTETDQRISPNQQRRQMARRPFSDRGCIKDPERFYDREGLLREVFNDLSAGINVSLVGNAQIGKSSILWQIFNQGMERIRSAPDRIILLNMQNILTEDDLFNKLCIELELDATYRGYELKDRICDRRYVICVDECDRMISFTGEERIELRGLADGEDAPFTIVTASPRPLHELFPDTHLPTSPFHNLFTFSEKTVEPFTPEIAREFIEHRLKGTGIEFDRAKVEDWIQETEGHPAKLQAIADIEYLRIIDKIEE
jgi:hypothetical protein